MLKSLPKNAYFYCPAQPHALTFVRLLGMKFMSDFLQDEKLKKLVELHGSEDWKVIASLLSVSILSTTNLFMFLPYFI